MNKWSSSWFRQRIFETVWICQGLSGGGKTFLSMRRNPAAWGEPIHCKQLPGDVLCVFAEKFRVFGPVRDKHPLNYVTEIEERCSEQNETIERERISPDRSGGTKKVSQKNLKKLSVSVTTLTVSVLCEAQKCRFSSTQEGYGLV